MIDTDWAEYWWSHITGPRKFVNQVTDALLDCSVVILSVPADLPWRHQMRMSIESLYKQQTENYDLLVHVIDANDECPDVNHIGKFLLNKFASGDVQIGYREKSGATIQTYLIQNEVLKDLVIWVKGTDSAQAESWIRFCRGFVGNIGAIRFVIETPDIVADSKRARVLSFEQSVSTFDLQLFNSILLDSLECNYTDNWKRYIAALAANLCGIDAEVSEMLIVETNFMVVEPLAGIEHISAMQTFSRRGNLPSSNHILHLCRSQATEQIEQRVWIAQVQTIFPLLELERLKFIERWQPKLVSILETNNIVQYGQTVNCPQELVSLPNLVDRNLPF